MEYILTFKSTNLAIKGEQFLLEQKLHVGVLPLPSKIRAGCGICLRIVPDEIKSALEALDERGIDEFGLYSRVPDGNHFAYTEVSDRSVITERSK